MLDVAYRTLPKACSAERIRMHVVQEGKQNACCTSEKSADNAPYEDQHSQPRRNSDYRRSLEDSHC